MTMQDFQAWLKRRLYERAAEIQLGFAGRLPTSRELDAVACLLALAEDTDNLSEHVFLLFSTAMLIGDIGRSFEAVRADCFGSIGAVSPRDATDLVRQLIMRSLRHRSSFPSSPGQ